ncbi:hypothetical protein [Geobacter anodireducens]|uniref:Phage protein n=1 Tax=Geobacter anodireducens TaxID=1340425 RepID=A0ABR9NY08_9BACT|nr:hypothetical protein [Geobacter anodireducens]MBE2889130.1 hypothetical protein [Geobacter anodireducens]
MLSFRSLADIEAQRPRLPPRIARCLTAVMDGLLKAYEEYDPEDDGYVAAVTPETTNADAVELMGTPWINARWEGVSYDKENRCFISCVLFNNQFGISFVIDDAPWLSKLHPDFRDRLVYEMGGEDAK